MLQLAGFWQNAVCEILRIVDAVRRCDGPFRDGWNCHAEQLLGLWRRAALRRVLSFGDA